MNTIINEISLKWQAIDKGLKLARAVLDRRTDKVEYYAKEFTNFADHIINDFALQLSKKSVIQDKEV